MYQFWTGVSGSMNLETLVLLTVPLFFLHDKNKQQNIDKNRLNMYDLNCRQNESFYHYFVTFCLIHEHLHFKYHTPSGRFKQCIQVQRLAILRERNKAIFCFVVPLRERDLCFAYMPCICGSSVSYVAWYLTLIEGMMIELLHKYYQ